MKTTHLLTGAALLLAPAVSVASHPEPYQMARVQILAHELEQAARHVHREAERRAHHGWWEERALRRLHELEDRARHFHRQVERYRQDPYHTEADLRRLVRSYRRAEEAVHWMHADRHVERDFYRVARLMDELLAFYGHRPDPGWDRGYRGHGDHDWRERRAYPRRYWFDLRWQWQR